jgi:hypothetical protein
MSFLHDLHAIAAPARGNAKAELLVQVLKALDEKAVHMAAQLAEVESKLKVSLLELTPEQFSKLELDKRQLAAAMELAEGLKAEVRTRKAQAEENEAAAPLQAEHAALMTSQANFAERWHAFYAVALPQFGDLLDELKRLEAERARLNGAKRMHAMRYKRQLTEQPEDLREINLPPISEGYVERLCLPEANIPREKNRWLPMAYKGAWWGPREDEGQSPEWWEEFRRQQAEREATHKAKQAALTAAREASEAGSRYHDMSPRTGRPLPPPYGPQAGHDDIAENQARANEFHVRNVA